ncbi:hypothetical protein [Flavobacterium sp.]|uniref:hypothetical protein n=1 Tax=Flavobacterium sp. TaxID=239 RepID=UPI00391A5DAD
MVESVVFLSKTQKSVSLPCAIQNHKLIIETAFFDREAIPSFDLVITFKNDITSVRNHDYTWVKCNNDFVSSSFSPKIIKLDNGFFVQPNLNYGYWEIQKKNPKVLYWRFHPQQAHPLTVYSGEYNQRVVAEADSGIDFKLDLALLFTTQNAIEFSRSSIPFSSVACFTDHCDFDTLPSLKLQRTFFKKHNIKVTKGFFLNHFSKRTDNASVEFDRDEFEKWLDDGHELAYHSLSQSLKNDEESFKNFFSFTPPFGDVPTWIDHGYQSYNFSLYQKKGINEADFSNNLKEKSITTLWNYIDSGTTALGVINQLNPNDFTLNSFYSGIKKMSLKTKLSLLIKNIMFHYYADEAMILKYKSLASSFKKMIQKKNPLLFFNFLGSLFSLAVPILKVLIFWNQHKNKPYKLAKYTPLVFKHTIAENEFYVFQTIEMIDFRMSLHPDNINKLINESGIFIAHTYFSVPMKYHEGRMFKNPETIDEVVEANFKFLGEKMKNQEIWNPTIKELVQFLANFEKTVLDINADGKLIVINAATLPYRTAI